MKAVIIAVLIGAANFAWGDFATDTSPFYLIDGTNLHGMKIVKGLPSQSGLAKIGVKKGDIVLAWNHKNIENNQAAQDAYSSKSIYSAKVIRDGKGMFLGSEK